MDRVYYRANPRGCHKFRGLQNFVFVKFAYSFFAVENSAVKTRNCREYNTQKLSAGGILTVRLPAVHGTAAASDSDFEFLIQMDNANMTDSWA